MRSENGCRCGKGPGITARAMLILTLLALATAIFATVCFFAIGYQSMLRRELLDLEEQGQAIARLEQQTGESLQVPSWQKMQIYQKLTRAMVFFVDTDYVAAHLSQEESDQVDAQQNGELAMRTRVLDAMDQQFIARALLGETVTEVRSFELVHSAGLFVGLPLKNRRGAIVGALMLLQPVDRKLRFMQVMRLTLLYSAVFAVAMAAFISLRFVRRFGQSLRQIEQAALRIGEGDYNVQLDIRNQHEAGMVAKAVKTLALRLKSTISTLMEERDQLGIIVNSIDEGIVAVDTNGKFVRYNQAFLALMEIDNIEAMEENGTENARQLYELMRSCLYSRSGQRDVWTTPSGRNILVLVSPLLGANREILGGVALLQDVSESERLEQLRRDYVANVSHELRTPLTGIRGMVEPLLDGYMETEEEKQDCYRVIYKETLRLEKLIGDMLDFSRLQDRRIELDLERVEVRGIIETALRRVSGSAAEAGISLSAELPEKEISCIGDENRILQVLTIFLDNALSFTPGGGRIVVYASNEKNWLRLGVRDTGVGIEPKDLPFIWERFYKSDKSRMRTSGTGLGLAIARLVVELMGGEIDVDTQVGKGSDFYFKLKRE